MVNQLKGILSNTQEELKESQILKDSLNTLAKDSKLFKDGNLLKLTGTKNDTLNDMKQIIESMIIFNLKLPESIATVLNVYELDDDSVVFEVSDFWKKIVILQHAKNGLKDSSYKIEEFETSKA